MTNYSFKDQIWSYYYFINESLINKTCQSAKQRIDNLNKNIKRFENELDCVLIINSINKLKEMINLISKEQHEFYISDKLQLNTASYPSLQAIQQSFREEN